jgi:hypothetical protein
MLIGFILATMVGTIAAGVPSISEQLLEPYYSIHKSLASDTSKGVSTSAAQIEKISREAAGKDLQMKSQLVALADAAAKLQTSDLKSARNGFGELSDKLIAYLQKAKAQHNPPYQVYCPMLKKNWLQADKEIRNPYYGSSMPTCGELVEPAKPTGNH